MKIDSRKVGASTITRIVIYISNTIRNFNGKPDFVGCLLVKNGLWPADFSIMYTYYWYKMFKITVHCREVSGPESVLNQ